MYDNTRLVNGQGARYNQSKTEFHLIPPSVKNMVLSELINLTYKFNIPFPIKGLIHWSDRYSFGAAKYPNAMGDNGNYSMPNWALGQSFMKMYIACIYRHYYAYLSGEILDRDFVSSPHLSAVAWNLAALLHQFNNYEIYSEFDDRSWVGFSHGQLSTEFTDCKIQNLQTLGSIIAIVESSNDINDIKNVLVMGIILCLFLMEKDESDSSFEMLIHQEELDNIKAKAYG
jgi:hypothetical protein